MNKVILMGRLTKDPEVRYSQAATPVAVAKCGIAVKRSYVKPGEPDVDFFNLTAFGRNAEFFEKYFRKGQMVAVAGRIQNNSWEDQQKVKHTNVDIIVEEQHFAESKASFEARASMEAPSTSSMPSPSSGNQASGFTPTNFDEDDDLPF